MTQTLRIANGDIDDDISTGRPKLVSSIEKGSQDVARHVLSAFDAFFQEGNELINNGTGNTNNIMSEALVSQYISEAINRLIVKQQVANEEERIVKINQIKTQRAGLSTVVFLVEVLFSNGQVGSVVNTVNLKEVELNQQTINPANYIS